MPPVLAATAAIATSVSAAFAAVGSAVGAIAASLHIAGILSTSIIGSLTVGKALLIGAAVLASTIMTKANSVRNQGVEVALKLDPTMPRQIAVGMVATGGSNVYAFCYNAPGEDRYPNMSLVRIIALSDWPIDSIVAVMEGDQQLTFTGDFYSGMVPCDQHKGRKGSPCMYMQVFKGSFTPTASAFLIGAEPNGLWTSDHKGVGVAYAVVRYIYDDSGKAFPNGEPQLTFIVNGAPLYDQRYDSTRTDPSRTGDQRLADPTTWEFSPALGDWTSRPFGGNVAVVIQQLLRGFYVNGVLLMGAGADDKDLPDSMLTEAYNACDVARTVPYTYQPYYQDPEPWYRCGMMLDASRSTLDMLTDLTYAMDGNVYDRGGVITILPGAARTATMDLTDLDIDWSEEASWQPEATLSSLYNNVVGSYVSEADLYSAKPYPVQRNSTYATDDGERLTLQRDLGAVNSPIQAQYIPYRRLQASRYQGVLAFVGPLWLLELEQGDWFTLTSDRWGFTKTFEAIKANITTDLKVAIIAQEVDASIDNEPTYVDDTSSTGSESADSGSGMSPPTLISVLPDSNYIITWRNPPESIFDKSAIFRSNTTDFADAVLVSSYMAGSPSQVQTWVDPIGAGTYYWWVQAYSKYDDIERDGPMTLAADFLTSACGGTVLPIMEFNFKDGTYWDGTLSITDAEVLADTTPIIPGSGLQLDYYTPRPAGPWGLDGSDEAGGEAGSRGINIAFVNTRLLDIIASGYYAIRMTLNVPAPIGDGRGPILYFNDGSDPFSGGWEEAIGWDGPSNNAYDYQRFVSVGPKYSNYDTYFYEAVFQGQVTYVSTWQQTPDGSYLSAQGRTAVSTGANSSPGSVTSAKIVAFNLGAVNGSPYTDTTAYLEKIVIYDPLDAACLIDVTVSDLQAVVMSMNWDVGSAPDINWSAAGGSTPDHYYVYRNTSNDFSTATNVSGSIANTTFTYSDTDSLSDDTKYYWWVVAADLLDAALIPSNAVQGVKTSYTISGVTTDNNTPGVTNTILAASLIDWASGGAFQSSSSASYSSASASSGSDPANNHGSIIVDLRANDPFTGKYCVITRYSGNFGVGTGGATNPTPPATPRMVGSGPQQSGVPSGYGLDLEFQTDYSGYYSIWSVSGHAASIDLTYVSKQTP